MLCFLARGWMMAWYLSMQMATRVHTDTFTSTHACTQRTGHRPGAGEVAGEIVGDRGFGGGERRGAARRRAPFLKSQLVAPVEGALRVIGPRDVRRGPRREPVPLPEIMSEEAFGSAATAAIEANAQDGDAAPATA